MWIKNGIVSIDMAEIDRLAEEYASKKMETYEDGVVSHDDGTDISVDSFQEGFFKACEMLSKYLPKPKDGAI